MPVTEPIAVVGLAVRFPGSGPDLDLFWRNVATATDCSREVPPDRWVLPPARCIDPRPARPDSVPHARGYFLDDFTPDLTGLDVSAELVRQLDPLFHLVLDVGGRAWRTANTHHLDRRKAGVILGNICLPTEKANALARKYLGGETNAVHPLNRYVAGLPAGLLAKALGLGGGAFTLDAACASSLYAVKLACDELQSGRADVMLAGGLNRADSQYTSMGFAQLRALSPSGRCSPFDKASDGLMVGEGAGIFVLKRLSDAERDGDTIHGVLSGWGLSNDLAGNLLAPAKEGQLRAMRAAYTMAGWEPNSVGLIECHATGTPVGDAVEFDSLRALWGGAAGRAVIGSVKSTVGHLLTGAGAAALAKVLLAIKHRMLPPQANFSEPNPVLKYADGPLRVLSKAEPWEAATRRRAAVSGFGFGGVNAHLLVEEYAGASVERRPTVKFPASEPIAVVGLAARVGPWGTTEDFRAMALGGGVRHEPKSKANGWSRVGEACPPGHFIDELTVPLDRFRIPPKELEELLPQQVLMLQTAADAMADAKATGGERCGVFVGLGLDLNTTNYHVRWSGQTDIPPLTADRTMGALGSIAASRIARLFGCGGPSFTCCSEESSSGTAVQLAVRALRLGDVDHALVGGVDLTGDPRQLLSTTELTGERTFADAAAALVLKRLSDAERDGDRVYAVIRGVGAASGGSPEVDRGVYATSFVRACADAVLNPDGLDLLETAGGGSGEREAIEAILANRDRPEPLVVSSPQARLGYTGFAGGAVALVRACLALHTRILPPTDRDSSIPSPRDAIDLSSAARFWLADLDSLRRAAVATAGADGSVVHVVLEEHAATPSGIPQPLGDRPEAMFAVDAETPAELHSALLRLRAFAEQGTGRPVERLAREWLHGQALNSGHKLGAAVVARSGAELAELADAAVARLAGGGPLPPGVRDRVFVSLAPLGQAAKIAFVFPGSGNQFAGMGRGLGIHFPQVLHRQQAENRRLRSQYAPELFWADSVPQRATASHFLFGQVTLGTLVSDTLVSLGLRPSAMVGKSLGESAGLFGLRVWADRDEMLERIERSTLFGSDLGPPYNSARRHWGIDEDAPFDWVTGVVAASAEVVRHAISPGSRAFVLIVNTPAECVIGGERSDVEAVTTAVGKPFVPLSGVTLAHCEAGRPVEQPYRELHTLPVTAPPGLTVYSGARGEPYPLTSANAADSITAGLLHVIDFPKVVETAYRDGVRAFIEVGPGNSCTRMIGAILGDRPHLARSACAARTDELSQILRVLAACHAERLPLDVATLDPPPTVVAADRSLSVTIPVGLPTAAVPGHRPTLPPVADTSAPVKQPDFGPLVAATARTSALTAEAHGVFLRFQQTSQPVATEAVNVQNEIIRRLLGEDDELAPVEAPLVVAPPERQPQGAILPDITAVPRSLTFEQCTEFAVGKIGAVLGSLFAEVDSYPTRVRLPEGPLMLVDRVLSIEGEPKSMQSGRVVTDHTVHAERWYLDNGRCPTSVTVEAGQADLFLSGFLGIDFQTKGLAVYRLLDAVVTFHRGLPAVGERIEYDIHIDEFFQQGDSWLFRFRFEGTVNGQPLLSMKNGVAGFFTAAALAAGQGIVHTKLDKQPMPGKKPGDWRSLAPFDAPCSLDAEQVNALHRGDLVAAFGPTFTDTGLSHPMKLPSGMLKLVSRVPLLDPAGGRFGLGFVRAEYDIRPKEWFIECHFVDDKVMPGTLMYECCLHTLRTLLMRMGWVGEEGQVTCEPVPGVQSRLKCRGQVLDTTKLVTYEVSVKELGYGPEPFCVADALMFADGKPIVEIGNLSLRMSGITRSDVEAIWERRVSGMGSGVSHHEEVHPVPPGTLAPIESLTPQTANPKPRQYDTASIRAYSNGNPSEAFGEPYRVFDRDRVLARLPGPPYQFLDRVSSVTGEPFVLKEGAACTAEYAVPPGEWYFEANRCARMPFSVLLEIALQPCGWLAAYCGSALTSDTDLSFRNLGGKATQFEAVGPGVGTLTTNVTMTKVAKSGGMIIQHYDMLVTAGGRKVYEGTTYFGFFGKEALKNQIGMPQAKVPFLDDDQKAFADRGELPHDPPFPAPMLRMVDHIDGYLPRGGKKGLGLIQGRIAVDPSFWFFKAHFYQDPVWPGSLGLESFLQLLKYVAWKRWKKESRGGWQSVAIGREHAWTYRGQVVPTDREVTVVLEVTAVDDTLRTLTADGFLTVDGRIIYQMQDFTLE
ncbi:MAG: hypothetical protein MUF18_06990 [Fimbriiglobus sp.]|nr:hypothetical protein [Fimbriiglobus sp.]